MKPFFSPLRLSFLSASLLLLCAVALPISSAKETPYRLVEVNSVPVSPEAREILRALNEEFLRLGPQPSEFWRGRTSTQNAQMREDAQQKIRELALRFVAEHPRDPVRWVAVFQMLQSRPEFIVGFRPGMDTAEGLGREFWIVDDTAKAQWEVELARWEAALERADDVPWEIHERRAYLTLVALLRENAHAGPAAAGKMETQLGAHAARFPHGATALALYQQLHRTKLQAGGDAALEIWGRLAESANATVAARARAEIERVEAARTPVELAFTAVDGRAVDLRQLRGKVVLIDFWATWCGPCIAELPSLKRVYAEYHGRGFEVVGITLENARLAAGDSPEQAAEKLAVARRKLVDFVTANEMPWPQHFDGRFWKNEFAQRFAVTGIPAMFLLDQDGRLVTTNARGEKLETEVRRLLGL